MLYPVKNDSRYVIRQEYTGESVNPLWVLRFCGEFVASSNFRASLVVRAAGHNAVRLGALVAEAKE